MLDQHTNILLAKKYMVESIYRSANIEGIGVTFPETQTICDGMSVSGHSVDDINAVNDLKHAWQWIFDNIDQEVDVNALRQLNRIAGKYTVINPGTIRDKYDEPIRVPLSAEKDYYPPVPPAEEVIDEQIKTILSSGDVDAALDLFCYVSKSQFFNDGNKRTATLITNMFMIKNGLGVFSIPVKDKLKFYELLTSYYDNDSNLASLKDYLKTNCLTGNSLEREVDSRLQPDSSKPSIRKTIEQYRKDIDEKKHITNDSRGIER